MHMQGQPRTMQANPHYYNIIEEVCQFLAERIAQCEAAGIKRENIILDPGLVLEIGATQLSFARPFRTVSSFWIASFSWNVT